MYGRRREPGLLPRLQSGRLLLADRGFFSFALWGKASATCGGSVPTWQVSALSTCRTYRMVPGWCT